MSINTIAKLSKAESSSSCGNSYSPRPLLCIAYNVAVQGIWNGTISVNSLLPSSIAQRIFNRIIDTNKKDREGFCSIEASLLFLAKQIENLKLKIFPNTSTILMRIVTSAVNLENLDLSVQLSDLEVLQDIKFPSLKAVTLSRLHSNPPQTYKKIHDSVLAFLKTNPTIISLDVDLLEISYNFLNESNGFSQLKKLSLSNHSIWDTPVCINNPPHLILTNLVTLKITNSYASKKNENYGGIPFALQFTQLQSLTIVDLKASDVTNISSQLSSLSSLDLNTFEIPKKHLQILIKEISKASRLTSLNLSFNTRCQEDALSKIIEPLGQLTGLSSLSLAIPGIAENGLQFMEKLTLLSSLKIELNQSPFPAVELNHITSNLMSLTCQGGFDFNNQQVFLKRFRNLTFLDCSIEAKSFYSPGFIETTLNPLFPCLKTVMVAREKGLKYKVEKTGTFVRHPSHIETTVTNWYF